MNNLPHAFEYAARWRTRAQRGARLAHRNGQLRETRQHALFPLDAFAGGISAQLIPVIVNPVTAFPISAIACWVAQSSDECNSCIVSGIGVSDQPDTNEAIEPSKKSHPKCERRCERMQRVLPPVPPRTLGSGGESMVNGNRIRHSIAAFACGVLLMTAFSCRGLTPIYEVNDAKLLPGASATVDDASEAIGRAGRKLGWEIEKESPGVLKGTLHLRRHVAVVRIEHDTQVFSIHGVETQNIRREGDRIHPNYNGWIHFLEQKIAIEPVRHTPL